MSNRKFILHWLDGSTNVVYGHTIAQAFTNAGYGAGAVRALDYWEEVKDKQDDNNENKENN